MEVKKLFSFHGRVGRGAFWGLSIASVIPEYGLAYLLSTVSERSNTYTLLGLLLLVVFLLSFVIQLATSVKRWHDRDKSGWWTLINAIPIIGVVWSLIELGILAGTEGDNQYGAASSGSPFGDGPRVSHNDPLARMRT